MKQTSGNDAIVARGLYKSEYEFRPTHEFWFQSNYRPGFDPPDSGNKRRYIEIPFDNDLTSDPLVVFNSKLKLQMRQDSSFRKAVLAWCVQGAVEWRRDAFGNPDYAAPPIGRSRANHPHERPCEECLLHGCIESQSRAEVICIETAEEPGRHQEAISSLRI